MSILELLLLFIAITVPLGWYTVVGWRREAVSRTVGEFFIFDKKLNEHYFVQTSVAYAFQVAAIFLFADWGFRYGIGGFWVPLFWGLGYFLLIRFVNRMESFTQGSWTLHGFLRNSFGDSRTLQSTAAILTIVGLSGTMVVEADYASNIFSIFNEEATFRYAVGIFLAVFCLVYVLSGGYKAAVLTDEKQLPLAYLSLILVIFFTLLVAFENGFTAAFWTLNVLLILLFVLMFWKKGGFDVLRNRNDRTIFIPVFGLMTVTLACVLSFFTNQKPIPSNDLTSLSLFATPLAQGPILLFSLFLANFFWMLVDISTWQRIASVSIDTAEQDIQKRLQPIRKGLVKIMWESPISWGLGAIFGMSLRYTGVYSNVDEASANISMFVSGLATGQIQSSILGPYAFFVLPLFFVAVIAIMLSTIDSYLSAVTFTAMYDLPPYRDRLHQKLDEISAQPIEQSRMSQTPLRKI
jgi:hypothetical protein